MIQVKLFPQPGAGLSGIDKLCIKWEENINEWLKQKIEGDIIDVRPGYGIILVYYKT